MPNLLAHYGAQGIVTRGLLRGSDVKWILLGAFIPDVPWIVQRAARTLVPGLDLYSLRIYAVVQAALFFGLLLAAAFALLSSRPGLVFGILSLNVLLHLVLDSLQEKWGAGVHLLAPLRWDEWNAELFSMEGWITYGLTALGLAFCVREWGRRDRGGGKRGGGDGNPTRTGGVLERPPARPSASRLGAAGLLVAIYFLLPLPFLEPALASNTQFVRTLAEREERPGRLLVLDREAYLSREQEDLIVHTLGDTLRVEGSPLHRSAKVSVRATFLDEETVRVHELIEHRTFVRDGASYLALLILAAFWLSAARARLLAPRDPGG